MYDKILVPMALDHGISGQTLEVARALCGSKGKITALHVFEVPKSSVSVYIDEKAVDRAFERARFADGEGRGTGGHECRDHPRAGISGNYRLCARAQLRLHRYRVSQARSERLFNRLHGRPRCAPRILRRSCTS